MSILDKEKVDFTNPSFSDKNLHYSDNISDYPVNNLENTDKNENYAYENDSILHTGHRERIRKRFLRHTLAPFADHEALELLLFFAIPHIDTNPLAHRILDRFGSLRAAFTAEARDLLSVDGVGESTAALIKLFERLGTLASLGGAQTPSAVKANKTLADAIKQCAQDERVHCTVLFCDNSGVIVSERRYDDARISSAVFEPTKISAQAISVGAAAVIICERRRAAIAFPQPTDMMFLDILQAEFLNYGVQIDDFIIVSDSDYIRTLKPNADIKDENGIPTIQ